MKTFPSAESPATSEAAGVPETEVSAGATDEAAAPNTTMETPRLRRRMHQYALAGLGLLAAVAAIVWFWGEPIWRLLTDEQAIEALVEQAGVWGPLTLIAINILQIIVAPIPGYVVQLAAGYLFGPLWGGIFASVGMLAGAMLAMFLARTFGRPLAIWMLGAERIARWEVVTHSESPWVWLLLLVAPIGDSVYLLAGLSRVSYLTVFLIALVVRVPSVFLSTAIGGGAVPLVWMVVLVIIFGTLAAVAYRYRTGLSVWFESSIKERAVRSSNSSSLTLTPVVTEVAVDEVAAESLPRR